MCNGADMALKILVLGVGNILLSDEGVGVRAVEYLQKQYAAPDNVVLLDGGTMGMCLMDSLMNCDLLIVLDAVLGGGTPGSIYRLSGEELRKSLSFRDSTHQTDLVDTLICCELAGRRPEAVVLGMEPEDYTTLSTELTPRIAARLPCFCEAALEELRRNGVDLQEN